MMKILLSSIVQYNFHHFWLIIYGHCIARAGAKFRCKVDPWSQVLWPHHTGASWAALASRWATNHLKTLSHNASHPHRTESYLLSWNSHSYSKLPFTFSAPISKQSRLWAAVVFQTQDGWTKVFIRWPCCLELATGPLHFIIRRTFTSSNEIWKLLFESAFYR